MAGRNRFFEDGVVYSGVTGCVDRQFLLSPNHRPDQPLLCLDCPLEALDRNNDIIPVPSTINIIGSSLARAQAKHPVDLHWAESNSNHLHLGLSPHKSAIEEIPRFTQHVNSLIARQLNVTYEREGHLWASRTRFDACPDDGGAKGQLIYALTNTVKDNLVERVSETPFFSTYRSQAFGEELPFWFLDHSAYWAAGGNRKKGLRLKDFLRTVTLDITRLPELARLPDHQRQTFIRRAVHTVEQECADQRRAAGRIVIGVPALYATDPRDRPKTKRESGRQPLCHASDPEVSKAYAAKLREVMHEHAKASCDFRSGMLDREFPRGTFHPPMITVFNLPTSNRPPPASPSPP